MADFKKTLKLALGLEYSSPKNALHTNPGEEGYTFCGIYEKANPTWTGWPKIKEIIKSSASLKEASEKAYNSAEIKLYVEDLYKTRYWAPFNLDKLNQTAADEIFVFGINVGMKVAIRKAQKIAKVVEDGSIGPNTIFAINSIPEAQFDLLFDEEEIKFYDELIAKRPSFAIFRKGWHNRARAV